MPEYVLRNLDPHVWSSFTERASREGWQIRPLISSLIESYASGQFTPSAAPPVVFPLFGWLRAHYRQAAQSPEFAGAVSVQQWELLLKQVLRSEAGLEWRALDDVPVPQRPQILDWLARTSNLPSASVLTLRATRHIWKGADMRSGRPYRFEVLGLPPGQHADIAHYNGGWRILHLVGDESRGWTEPFVSPEEALANLAEALRL